MINLRRGNTRYYHNDHLGTPQKMTDASGVVVWAADYKPFGEVTINPSSTITNNLRFLGQYYDAETGLNYNYFRDYNPTIGRYIESDPLGVEKGKNHLYVYVRNNPENLTDPTGLFVPPSKPKPPATYPNGNVGDPNFYPQDWVCSEPVPQVLNECSKTKSCCKEHDLCYAQYGCNKTSWQTTILFTPCGLCNLKVVMCFLISGYGML